MKKKGKALFIILSAFSALMKKQTTDMRKNST